MSDQEKWEREKKKQQSILKHDMAEEIEGREVTDEEAERIICGELKDKDQTDIYVGGIFRCHHYREIVSGRIYTLSWT